jgi:hypothetical protein
MKNILVIAASRSGHNFVMNMIRSWFPAGMIPKLVNYENMLCEDYQRTVHQWCLAGQFDDAVDTFVPVLVVRDLLNWWASYLQTFTPTADRNIENMFNAWCSHVREANGETSHIHGLYSISVVDYDRFAKSKGVRQVLCDVVGGMYNENRIDEVPTAGGGSAFDQNRLPGRLMKTNKRFMNMLYNELYVSKLRQYPEAVRLYREYFTLTKKQEEFINTL